MSFSPVRIPGWRHTYSGKVRDLYVPDGGPWADHDVVLVVASDRISAYDVVLPTLIPDKGAILTQMSLWWFDHLDDVVPNHLVSVDVPDEVAGRAMICHRLEMYPIECVARGYLAGSGLQEYRETGAVCGVQLPGGLTESARLADAIFTPAAKVSDGGHDENITFDQAVDIVTAPVATQMRDMTLELYQRAATLAQERGIILADTKVEFGRFPNTADGITTLVLGDEVLTPDSSRYWDIDQWEEGAPTPSFDKQFVRDWLSSPQAGWDRAGGAPAPELPADIVAATRERYLTAFETLTGRPFRAVS